MSDLEVLCITDMAAIHQTTASFFFSFFTSLLPSPLSLSVNTTLQLLTLNFGGDKDQAWPCHLQCYSLERKAHKRMCTHTYKCQAALPPWSTQRPNSFRVYEHNAQHFYLVFLGLDEQFGRGDARLVGGDLILEKKDNAAISTVSVYTSIHKHSSFLCLILTISNFKAQNILQLRGF